MQHPCRVQVDIEHVHLAVLGGHISFLVDDQVGEVVAAGFVAFLGEAAEREPNLVVKRQLLVPVEEGPVNALLEVEAALGDGVLVHVGEVLGQADHLRPLLCALLDETRAGVKVFFGVLGRAELHDAHHALEVVLLRRQRVLVVGNSVQDARHLFFRGVCLLFRWDYLAVL